MTIVQKSITKSRFSFTFQRSVDFASKSCEPVSESKHRIPAVMSLVFQGSDCKTLTYLLNRLLIIK